MENPSRNQRRTLAKDGEGEFSLRGSFTKRSSRREAIRRRFQGRMIFDMGGRGLTHKQQKFAELLAAGCTKVEAFRRAYPSDQRGKGTEWEGAKRVGAYPKSQPRWSA
jgi:hypothetical protein